MPRKPALETEHAFARALGCRVEDLELLANLFREAMAPLGLDADAIFARLTQGMSIDQALGVPAGACDLLYARAHQWFKSGRPDRAEPIFRALCILYGSVSDHWVGYGVCLRLREQCDAASHAFALAGRFRNDWAIPHFHLLELAVHREDWPGAERHVVRFFELLSSDTPEPILAEARRMRSGLEQRRAGREDDVRNDR